ncbi:MAG: ATP-dependent DNA helicase RecG [Pseudomonadota bacterium]
MVGRPEILFPLFAGLETLDGVGPRSAENFKGLAVEKPRDLLFTLPYSGTDRRLVSTVQMADLPKVLTVEITVGRHIAPRARGRPYRIEVQDAATGFHLIFFHAHPDYLEKTLPTGSRRVVSGKVELFDGLAQMTHPDFVVLPSQAGEIPEFEPVYPKTAGITQKLMLKATRSALARVPDAPEWIDPGLRAERHWPAWREALDAAHAPRAITALSSDDPARARLAYDELLAHQMTLALARARVRRAQGRGTQGDGSLRQAVLAGLPYRPTAAQMRCVGEIAEDMASGRRMNRLLQGDVGAGKTLVALSALLIAVEAGGQGVMMAPTEILARQHLEGLRPLAEAAGVRLEILTGRDKGVARREKLAALADGAIQILVGTHAVFQKDVGFADLRLAVVDEQHRFGVRQRLELGRKGEDADVLVMTATPIPRSLSLAHYGDMDISVLDEKPPGRKPVTTALINMDRMDDITDRLRRAIEEGRQAYWVCPMVRDSEVADIAAAEARYASLKERFGDDIVMVHGQLRPEVKDAAMERFAGGEAKLLVATTVIEVGVDVPSATLMVIEQAERFGLAQLHQLRGRVGRGSEKSVCVLLRGNELSETGRKRLALMRETQDGFRIAEEDLELRGGGELLGTRQSGEAAFRIADLEHVQKWLPAAHADARLLMERDGGLTSERGEAARILLYLFERDWGVQLLRGG